MLMKITVYVLAALLVVALGAAAFFYMTVHEPLTADLAKMKEGMAALDKTKAELNRLKEEEKKASAWLAPAAEVFSGGLSDEIKAGKAEVITADSRIVVNIAEDLLYQSGSYTFTKESPKLRERLANLLKKNELRGKELVIGNATEGVAAQGRGRKKVPAKDARTLASERTAALVRDLEKNGVDPDALIAAAYSEKRPDIGNKIKTHRTVIVILMPASGAVAKPAAPAPVAQKPAPAGAPAASAPAAPQAQPKPIPIQPAPKAH